MSFAVNTIGKRRFLFARLHDAQAAATILEALTGQPCTIDMGIVHYTSLVPFLRDIADLEWPASLPRELAANLTKAEKGKVR